MNDFAYIPGQVVFAFLAKNPQPLIPPPPHPPPYILQRKTLTVDASERSFRVSHIVDWTKETALIFLCSGLVRDLSDYYIPAAGINRIARCWAALPSFHRSENQSPPPPAPPSVYLGSMPIRASFLAFVLISLLRILLSRRAAVLPSKSLLTGMPAYQSK